MARIFDLLIVDDDPAQLKILCTLLRELNLEHRCHYASSGQQALDFLKHKAPFQGAVRPNLILLDLNMPGMDGCEVLRQIKSDPELRTIPVVMLSSSQAIQDVDACYREHANAYVRKPTDLESNLKLLRDIDRFWAELVVLPQ
jgi:CheY-like chemotaxis protein